MDQDDDFLCGPMPSTWEEQKDALCGLAIIGLIFGGIAGLIYGALWLCRLFY